MRIKQRSTWMGALTVAVMLAFLGPSAAESQRLQGITIPIKDAALSAMVAGTVSKLVVEEGDVVEAGDIILELDKVQETLEVARRRLVWLDRSELRAASHRLETLHRDLASTHELFKTTKSVSMDELDKKKLEVNLAGAELARVEASEAREELEFHMAEEQLRRRDLTAPMSGTITTIDVEVGEYREPRQPMVRLVDVSRFYFVGNVTEAVGQGLTHGKPVRVRVGEGATADEMTGTVCFASATVDPASGLLLVKAVFDNPGGRVRPGTAAELFIEVSPDGD
jgi:RND family efflux transporter MFP subunit